MYILNLILPVWMFFLFSWWIAFVVIIGNFVIDAGIYRWFFMKYSDSYFDLWKYIWRAYFFGFLADLVGAAILILLYSITHNAISYFYIYDSWYNIVVHIVVLGITGYLLYVLNRYNLKKSSLSSDDIHKLSLIMAIATAPYTFLIPASVFGW